MAIAFDNGTNGSYALGNVLTFSHTVGTGDNRLLLVVCCGDNNVTSVTFNGVSLTNINSRQMPAPENRYNSAWFLLNPASGAHDVVATGGNTFTMGSACSYTGVKQSGQPDANTTDIANSTSLTLTLTTIADKCWTFLFGRFGNIDMAPGTGSTQRITQSGTQVQIYDSNSEVSPAGSKSMQMTTTNSSSVSAIMASFSPAAEAAVTSTRSPSGGAAYGSPLMF